GCIAKARSVIALDQQRRDCRRAEPRFVGCGSGLLPRNWIKFNCSLGFLPGKAIGHHYMDVCAGVGKRRKSISTNAGLILNLFSPQHDPFHSHCHSEPLLFIPKFASDFPWRNSIAKLRRLQPTDSIYYSWICGRIELTVALG